MSAFTPSQEVGLLDLILAKARSFSADRSEGKGRNGVSMHSFTGS